MIPTQMVSFLNYFMNLPTMQETCVGSLGQKDAPEEGMAIPSYILAWKVPRTEKPGGLQFTGSQRNRYD